MKEIDSIIRVQTDTLMKMLEQSRDAHCGEAHEQADLQGAEFRRRARRIACERVSKAAIGERERLELSLRMAQAEIDTQRRKGARKRDLALIEAGRKMLETQLKARWSDAAQRQAWAETTIVEAASVLLGRTWTLEHPVNWPQGEREHAIAFARAHCDASVSTETAEDLAMGLRIRSGGALVDMSIAGLLASEGAIEGELLAECNRDAEGEAS